jgi:hypothetical protein
MPVIRLETKRGRPISHGRGVLVAVARSVRADSPGGRGGLVWNRPVGVEVDDPGGRRFVPIPDPTRRIQFLLLGSGIAAAALLRLFLRRRSFFAR